MPVNWRNDRMDQEFPLVREAHERNDETIDRIYIVRRFSMQNHDQNVKIKTLDNHLHAERSLDTSA